MASCGLVSVAEVIEGSRWLRAPSSQAQVMLEKIPLGNSKINAWKLKMIPKTIHVGYIYLHLPYFTITNQQNVGEYTSPMVWYGSMVSMFLESPFSREIPPTFELLSVSFLFGGSSQVSFREFEKVRTATDR